MSTITITKKLSGFLTAIALLFSLTLASCKKSDGGGSTNNSGNASTSMGATDAAIDDASVSGAFVTITDIQLDGQSIQGFNKTTVNLNAFKNGNVKNFGTFDLQGKSYSTLTFVLDYAHDSSGNVPGAYILTTDNVKHALTGTTNTITITKNFTLNDLTPNAIVADFDLRKMIIHPTTGDTTSFAFVTASELQNSVRFVDATQSAAISGTFTNAIYVADTVVAYVYKTGTFTSAEMQGQGASNIQFENAVTSSIVGAGGAYSLNFLDSGSYEIHFASYKDINHNGNLTLQGMFTSNVLGGNILALIVAPKVTLSANVTATAIVSVN